MRAPVTANGRAPKGNPQTQQNGRACGAQSVPFDNLNRFCCVVMQQHPAKIVTRMRISDALI
jgi:hypothetical protein